MYVLFHVWVGIGFVDLLDVYVCMFCFMFGSGLVLWICLMFMYVLFHVWVGIGFVDLLDVYVCMFCFMFASGLVLWIDLRKGLFLRRALKCAFA